MRPCLGRVMSLDKGAYVEMSAVVFGRACVGAGAGGLNFHYPLFHLL